MTRKKLLEIISLTINMLKVNFLFRRDLYVYLRINET